MDVPEKPAKLGKVGPALKVRRQALRMSLAQVELETKIRGKFLTAFESGDYSSLPNDVYSRGFVQHYANHLGLVGHQVAIDYVAERGGMAQGNTKAPRLERPRRLVFTGRIVATAGVLLAVIAVLWYLLWQLSALAGAPRLTVTSPDSDKALTGSVINVAGNTTPGADVMVDESLVLTDTDGNFSEKVALQSGINTIHITSRSKLGKVTTVTRNILATLPDKGSKDEFPLAAFPGVAIKISATKSVAISVKVDNGDKVEQLVPAGWEGIYKGEKVISFSTNDAGAIHLSITNSIVSNKDLSQLGAKGEPRKDQVFNIDSAFQ